jgi:class 3 adenylate cyclase
MSSSRQLAAIMFTDIVGYTALMGEDEQRAKNRQLQYLTGNAKCRFGL